MVPDLVAVMAWVARLALALSVLLAVLVAALGQPAMAGRIAFTSHRAGSDIFLLDLSDLQVRNLTANATLDYDPVWSPDGTQLAFAFVRFGSMEIGVMDATGEHRRALTDNHADDISPMWSPDGQWIAFISYRNGNAEIYLTDANCAPDLCEDSARRLTLSLGLDLLPAWSPDGRRIAFMSDRAGDFEIYLMDANCPDLPAGCANNARNLTRNDVHDGSPDWSPDGRWLAFVSQHDGIPDLFVMDAGCSSRPESCGAPVRRLTDDLAGERNPVWSPDSRWIAFESLRDGSPGIYLMDVACGCVAVAILNIIPGAGFSWSPDSRYIAYFAARGLDTYLSLMDIERRLAVPLVRATIQDGHPAWQP